MNNETPLRDWSGDNWFLDNSFQCPIMHNGITYPTVTHAMMGAQADTLEKRLHIAKAPLTALKEIYQSLGQLPDDFKGPTTMRKLLEIKFGYSESLIEMNDSQVKLAQRLLFTGVRPLIYANNKCNQFWGDCGCPKHQEIKGDNVLGGLLMGVREKLAGYITRSVALNQTCRCEKSSDAFFMYALHGKLWLKPFCNECQVATGMFLAQNADNHEVSRFEKGWFPTQRGPSTTAKKVREPVNRIKVPIRHSIHPVFANDQFEDDDYIARWQQAMPWMGRLQQKELEKKLPQNVTFYLSGRIS